MLHSRDDNESHMDLPSFPEDAEAARVEVPSVLPDSQAEFLQGKPDSTYNVVTRCLDNINPQACRFRS